MREVEKNGIQIDVCPSCKGVWLDRGELDKLMSGVREVRAEYNEWHNRDRDDDDDKARRYEQQRYEQPRYESKHNDSHGDNRKKKKSMMDVFGDLFE